ncbi:penicillin acylase family protein [Shouchella shacheensis]|uniref:penicillin acylase family protein n=1 Tax=Shouchella shacheensis TaxID=1649580 RepID=UPI0007401D5F|nr:penicillin acylase family protein [Shouchella shacheensis]
MNMPLPERRLPPKKRLNWKRIVLITITIFVFVLIGVAFWAYLQLKKPIPETSGEHTLAGLHAPVNVYRDEQGVPHIEADNDEDLYYSQGYITAQDRMFQMDLSRRQASGMLSEVIGESALDTDKYFRTFGLRRAAEASLSAYNSETLDYLEAYAEGVNAYIENAVHEGTLPIEFRLLGYEPEPWTALDSLTIGKYMAYDLGGNWQGQAFRYWLAQNVSEEEALDLLPSYPEDGPVILEAVKDSDVDVEKAFANVSSYLPHPFNGSNNWVLSGEKTASGQPLLADDPHLGMGTPSIWYESHLSSPTVDVTGVIFAGVPGIILGHNQDIAWGVTNVGPDVQQLYLEERNPDNPEQFRYEGEWYDAEVVTEEIAISGEEEPVLHEVVLTRNGPLLSEYAHVDEEADYALSMRWTAHEASTELQAVLDYNRADDWDAFSEALTDFQTPAQNFVFASTDGTIAYRANGKIPIRSSEEDALLPVPGWDADYEWEGYIPWEELPKIVNPESGMISTANNQIGGEDYPYHLSHTWAQPYRHQRILDVLGESDAHTAEDMQTLQMDTVNLQAEEMLPILTEALNKESLRAIDREALEMLASWNQLDNREEAGPLLFHFWMEELSALLFKERIPEEMLELFEGRAGIVDELIRAAHAGDAGPWIEAGGGLGEVATASLQQAVDRAEALQGSTPEEWQWGEFHQVTFSHPLAAVTPLNYLFNASPTPVDGSRITVMAAGYNSETGATTHGAGWRGVMDLQDLSESYHIVGPGQSGHVTSDTYHSQLEDWVEGRFHATSTDLEVYRAEGEHLQLVPE